MAVLLPVLALGTCILGLATRLKSARSAVLGGAVIWGVVLVGMTEVLGALHHLGAFEVGTTWMAVLLVGVGCIARDQLTGRRDFPWQAGGITSIQRTPRSFEFLAVLRGSSEFLALLVGLTLAVLALAGVAALSPPNTWDSMTYHMARLINWMQTASLAPYPTQILRQLYLQPGAEFVLLHLQLLSGSDHLAGLVQWASMVGALVGTSVIARDLGAGRLGQLTAAIVTASVPIGALESTSTQNDYVVAFWLVCTAVFALAMTRAPRSNVPWAATCAFGASFGLALLTKATAYLYGLPMLIWVAAYLLKTRAWRALAPLAIVGVLAVVLNVGGYARNVAVFGSPTGPLDEGLPNDSYLNTALSPSLLASNVVRDLGLNLVATPLAPFNAASERAVRALHSWLNVDLADPRTTWGNETFSARSPGLAFDENFAGNPVHTVLLCLAVLTALGAPALRATRHVRANNAVPAAPASNAIRGVPAVPAGHGAHGVPGASGVAGTPLPSSGCSMPACRLWYTLALGSGFVLFAGVLRWQPWNTRLELPLFVLGAPLIAAVVDRMAPRLLVPLAAVLLVSMLPWIAYNQARPLVGPRSILGVSRNDQYFTNQPGLRAPYLGAVAFLADHPCDRVGFISTPDGWEYPLWPLLHDSSPTQVTIEHVRVANVSAGWPTPPSRSGSHVCAILAIDQPASLDAVELDGTTYRPAWAMGRIAILTP